MVLAHENVENLNILCIGLAGALSNTFLAEKCPKIFKTHREDTPTAEYDDKIVEAGGITRDMINLLLPVADVLQAADLMAPETWTILGQLFTPETSWTLETTFNAVQGSSTVKISKLSVEGEPIPFYNGEEAVATLKTAEETGMLYHLASNFFGSCSDPGQVSETVKKSLAMLKAWRSPVLPPAIATIGLAAC